jgi:ribosomal protein L11
LSAATITITVANDAKVVVSTTTLTVQAAVLKAALTDWRQAQVLTPAVAEVKDEQGNTLAAARPAVLKYPTISDVWREIIGTFIRGTLDDYLPSILEQRRLIDVANSTKQSAVSEAVK